MSEAEPPDFATLLAHLRTLAPPCQAPTGGAGSFDILYVCEREVCVWYTPTREGQEAREVIIPGTLLLGGWQAFMRAAHQARALEERELCALAGGAYGGRWLAALLAQLPGVQADLVTVRITPPITITTDGASDDGDAMAGEANRETLLLKWQPVVV